MIVLLYEIILNIQIFLKTAGIMHQVPGCSIELRNPHLSHFLLILTYIHGFLSLRPSEVLCASRNHLCEHTTHSRQYNRRKPYLCDFGTVFSFFSSHMICQCLHVITHRTAKDSFCDARYILQKHHSCFLLARYFSQKNQQCFGNVHLVKITWQNM
jgi:hypothetical protein